MTGSQNAHWPSGTSAGSRSSLGITALFVAARHIDSVISPRASSLQSTRDNKTSPSPSERGGEGEGKEVGQTDEPVWEEEEEEEEGDGDARRRVLDRNTRPEIEEAGIVCVCVCMHASLFR